MPTRNVPGMTEQTLAQKIAERLGFIGPDGFRFGGMSLDSLVGEGGEPFYAYDAGVLKNRLLEVRHALGERVAVLFSVKANPSLALMQVMQDHGLGFEVASEGELLLALAAGAPSSRIQYAGPGKTEAELERAIRSRIASINVESAAELENISCIAQRLKLCVNVALRVQIQALKSSRMRMVGGSQQFGLPVEDAASLLPNILNNQHLQLVGLHTYAGTQCFDAQAWISNAQALISLANRFERELPLTIQGLNFGGGFGVEYFEGDSVFDLEAAGHGLQHLINLDNRPDRTYTVELGRYIAATCGAYFARVLYVKEVGDTKHLILNGGMHHHAAAAGLGTVLKRAFPMLNASRIGENNVNSYHVCGSLCTPADSFGAREALAESRPGDWIVVLHSGAYGLSYSPLGFLSHAKPAEYLVENGQSRKIRDGSEPSQVLLGQTGIRDS